MEPLSGLREYVQTDATAKQIARRLTVSSLEVDRLIDVGVADTGDNLSFLRVGKVVVADKHPNADKLQLCQVDVGRASRARSSAVRGTSASVPPSRSGCQASSCRASRLRSTSDRSAASSPAG